MVILFFHLYSGGETVNQKTTYPQSRLSTDGSVDVLAGTPEGDYSFDYQICENLNPDNCSSATVTISVESSAMVAIDDIGEIVAESVVSYVRDEDNARMIERLIDFGINPTLDNKGDKPLEGKIFVFTGSLDTLTRDQAKDMVRDLGAKASGSVSSKTDYVVSGEASGSKLDKARSLGIPVMNEAEFIEFMKGFGGEVEEDEESQEQMKLF